MNLLRAILPTLSERAIWNPEDVFSFNNALYPIIGQQTIMGKREEVTSDFVGLVQGAYQRNGIVFACMMARRRLFAQMWPVWQSYDKGMPGALYSTPDLDILKAPWPNGVTGDLLGRMLDFADLGGTAFVARRARRRLVAMRPDWVTIVLGSRSSDDVEAGDLDAEPLGYIYHPGGRGSGRTPVPLLREEVAQYQYVDDPLASFRGMSWLTPIIREIEGDTAATTHKILFFENGATPNLVVTLDPGLTPGQPAAAQQAFDDWVARFKAAEPTKYKAYKTMFMAGGTTKAEVIGSNLRQMDFKITQGAGETRIAAAAGVPPIIVGLSEGLAAATYSNYGQARRAFADGTMRDLWGRAVASLQTIVKPPAGSRLWYDVSQVAFLQEDQRDAADIQHVEAQTIRTLGDGGYEPKSVIAAVRAQNWDLLEPTGLLSVQLQEPGTETPEEEPVPPPARSEVRDANGHLLGIRAEHGLEVKCHRCDEVHIVTA